MQPLLLDTCAVVWIAENEKLAPLALEALSSTYEAGAPTYVSPITAWEIGMLASRDWLKLLITPQRWFERFQLIGMEPLERPDGDDRLQTSSLQSCYTL
jgi:PIN domain nuclease of toxin-antitoxin system